MTDGSKTAAIVDWAARHGGSWWPAFTGLLIAFVIYAIPTGALWAWGLVAAGLVMAAIHPAGTMLRHHLGLAEVWQIMRQARELDRPDDARGKAL
jgi:hypothetical protein